MIVRDLAAAPSLPHQREGFFDFLALPPELRNDVYRYFFASADPCVLTLGEERLQTAATISAHSRLVPNKPVSKDTLSDTTTKHAILRTSRQINNEGAAILYGENEFVLKCFDPSIDSANLPFGKRNAALIHSLRIEFHSPSSHGLLDWWRHILESAHLVLKACPLLTALHDDTTQAGGAAFGEWRQRLEKGQEETEKEHVRRCLRWIRTVQELDGVSVPKKLRLDIGAKEIDPEGASSGSDDLVRVFDKAVKLAQGRK